MLSHSDYRIGWICALSIELAAAEAMLDRIHECLPNRVEDDNTYTYGEIGKHNIVIACLPAGVYGTNSAASVAVQMRSSFPSLRFCLLVGIAGGAPTFKTDIRLGDVVVSKPTPKYAGVIQYDYGKALNGQFISTGALDKPPPVLLKAIARLEATHHLYGNKIAETRAEVFEIWGQRSEVFFAPEEYADKLFISTYDHVDENRDTCDACDLSMLRPRIARSSNEPRIFYGLIASANQVLRNAVKRDLLSHQHDILCFEMEAAGLMDVLPCLVIRGICDYSDSHKNKNWQGCAALNAAAYARELVSVIPFHEVNCTPVVNSSVPHLADSNLVEFSGQPQQSLLTAPSSAPNDSYFDCTNEYEGQLTPLEGFASPLGPLHFYCEDDHGLAFLEDSLQDHDQAESSVLSDVKDLDRPYARFDNGSRAAVTADNLANAQSDDANFPVHSGTQDEYRSTLNTFPNPTEQFGQEPNTGSYGIVNIGIDIGTRYTRVAYGFPGGLNFGIHKWPHFNRRTARVPTEVSWDGQEYSWGYGSRLEAASTPWLWAILRMRNDFEQWMADVGISAPDPPHSPRFPEGEEASYALSHYLSSLWNHITDTLQRRHGHLIHASLTWHVVFALPDVWVDIAQVVFFDAVKISRIPDRTRLSLIKHNTGAVQAAVYDIFSRVRTNEAYIVCSAGSNIIHAVTYTRSRSNNVTMKRRYRHSWKILGGDTVDLAFQDALKRAADRINYNLDDDQLHHIMNSEWKNHIKRTFEQSGPEVYRLPLPSSGSHQVLTISAIEIAEAFHPTVAAIEDAIEQQIQQFKISGPKLQWIIIAGGLGKSPYVCAHLRRKYLTLARLIQAESKALSSAACRGAMIQALIAPVEDLAVTLQALPDTIYLNPGNL